MRTGLVGWCGRDRHRCGRDRHGCVCARRWVRTGRWARPLGRRPGGLGRVCRGSHWRHCRDRRRRCDAHPGWQRRNLAAEVAGRSARRLGAVQVDAALSRFRRLGPTARVCTGGLRGYQQHQQGSTCTSGSDHRGASTDSGQRGAFLVGTGRSGLVGMIVRVTCNGRSARTDDPTRPLAAGGRGIRGPRCVGRCSRGRRGAAVRSRHAMPCSVNHALAAARPCSSPTRYRAGLEVGDEPRPVLTVDGEQVCGR
jgi:hypothetical protein